ALGANLAAGGAIGAAMAQGLIPAAAAPATASSADPVARLAQLKSMLDQGLIAQADYDAAKADILKKLVG
ncbi:MAG TPA: SHOCT domain-containing protein, partial [Burkholderiaceae bacterium]